MPRRLPLLTLLLPAALCLSPCLCTSARADEATRATESLLLLSASADQEVPNDEFAATAAVERSDRSSAVTQSGVNKVVDTVAHAAREAGLEFEAADYQSSRIEEPVKPGSVAPPQAHWVTRATLVIKSRDLVALEHFLGDASADVAIESIASSLRRETRQALLDKLRGQAIATFRGKAHDAAGDFGYARYEVAQVSVNDGGERPQAYALAAPMARMGLASAEAAPVTITQGRTTVSVSVTGSVRLLDFGGTGAAH